MFKVNDIIIYDTNIKGPRILYVTTANEGGYTCIEVTLKECKHVSGVNLDTLKELGEIKHLENREVPNMEIMNLTDVYAEYFV